MLNIDCYLSESDDTLQSLPTQYIWDDKSLFFFQEALSSTHIQEKIKHFEEFDFGSNTDQMVDNINSILCVAAEKSLKQKKHSLNKVTKNKTLSKRPKWYDNSLTKLKRQLNDKEKLFRKFSKDPIIRSSFFSHLKLYKKTRKKKYKDYRKNLIEELDNLRDNDPKKYWSLLNNVANSGTNNKSYDISGNEWFDYFQNLNLEHDNPSKNISDCLKELEEEHIFSELDNKISKKEISEAISGLKNNKSSGFDSILNEMLKNSQSFLLNCFYKLFNTILTYGNFPKIWAKGFIVPLFKNGLKNDPANYRGITIGSNIGKLFTKVINNRLENFYIQRNLICTEQIGFCRKKRTSDHIFVLKTLIDKYTQSSSKFLYTCFVDFKKAFDSVWHLGLFYKLRKNGVSDLFYNVVKNMYACTELCVKVDNSLTNSFPSRIGVRQGDNLSPNLFKLFVNDLPEIFKGDCFPVSINSLSLNCLLYADDVVLLSESSQGLQNCLDKLNIYCGQWGLELNIKKTKVLIFNNTGRLKSTSFTFNGTKLENVKNYTYLGINFSASGSFTDAKKELYKKGLKAYFKFLKCFEGHKPKIKTLIHVFDHTVKPVLLYGSEIWGYFPGNKLLHSENNNFFGKLCRDLPLENIHKKFCKNLLEVNKRATTVAVMGELGRYPLMLEVLVNMLSYYVRLYNSKDKLLYEAFFVQKLYILKIRIHG